MNQIQTVTPPPDQEQDSSTVAVNLLDYLNTIKNHKFKIFFLALLAMLIGAAIAFNMTPVYQSTASILIEIGDTNLVQSERNNTNSATTLMQIPTQIELLQSRSIIKQIINDLDLLEHPLFLPSEENEEPAGFLDSTIAYFTGLLELGEDSETEVIEESEQQKLEQMIRYISSLQLIFPLRDTRIVGITYESIDRQLSADLANQTAVTYINYQAESNRKLTGKTSELLQQRLDEIKITLQQTELKLQNYREENNLLSSGTSGGVSDLTSRQLQELNISLIRLKQETNQTQSTYDQVKNIQRSDYKEYLAIPTVLENRLVSTLIESNTRAQNNLDSLKKRYGYKHPKIIEATANFNATSDALKNQIYSVVDSIITKLEQQKSNEKELMKLLKSTEIEMRNINRKTYQLSVLEREVSANQEIYDLFLNRLSETRETGDIHKSTAQIIDPATPAIEPIKPKKKIIILLAGILGMGFGILLAFFLEHLNNTLKATHDVEEKINLNLLGALPLLNLKKDRNIAHFVSDESQSNFSECMRTIRTGIILSNLDDPHKVILVTSSIPGEGKSTVTTNIALTLSEMGKVLLIDADMRKPSVRKLFGLKRGVKGLSDYLAGTSSLSESCQQWGDSELYLLSAGNNPPNPLDLLSSEKFKSLIEDSRAQYDHIIIDAPPIIPVSDARILANLAGAIIFVMKAESTKVPQIREAVKRVRVANGNILGGVLNQIDIKRHSKYSEYSDYNYTYSEADNNEETRFVIPPKKASS